MQRINANVAMLWSMALSLSLSLVMLRHLQTEGLHPIHAALIQALGCTLVLGWFNPTSIWTLLSQRDALVYFAVASLIGFTIPRLVVSAAVSHTGVGLTTLAFTLPLAVTYGIAILLKLESFDRWRAAFLTLTLAGVLLYMSNRMGGLALEARWFALLMIAPLSLGAANIYRSTAWPGDLKPASVALATAACSLASFAAIATVAGARTPLPFFVDPEHLGLLLLFMAAAGLEQTLMFRLQRGAGPLYVGQVGAIVVLFGGITGFLLFGEHYSTLTLAGSLMILFGVTSYCRPRGTALTD